MKKNYHETSNVDDIQRGKLQEKQQNKAKYNLKTWINSTFGARNLQLPVLMSTFHDKPCALEDFEPAKKFPDPSCAGLVTFG